MAENGNDAPATADVLVCGHISIDIIPKFLPGESDRGRLTPGSLIEVGEAEFCTGGAVSNTGIALHRLGTNVRLAGKVSDDFFGSLTLKLLGEVHPSLTKDIAQAAGEASSYTLVINPPGTDRTFIHCPGTNDTFSARDIAWDRYGGARHFHFGYPPLMKGMYDDGGDRLTGILKTARDHGMTVSLDMAMPGKGTAAYAADWTGLLSKALPYVDVFMPSLEEMLMMVNRDRYERMALKGDHLCESISVETIRALAASLLAMGCSVVVLKLGASGLYMRSAAQLSSMFADRLPPSMGEAWTDRELWAPCFRTAVAGTTGAGDCTIAGFIQGLLLHHGPEETMTGAVAVGACSVEHLGATNGIIPWDQVQSRIRAGWDRLPVGRPLAGWRWEEKTGTWTGPEDRRGNA
ncbi:Sugar or nucleoside kinase, ribokinase family [Cohnella sp. OV330]|uniref:carbohydrate kinase family protein n=1 Tax=Cohnella sp. OV330 TaxID=1855288 RepID=UPI0008EB7D59|nr:carbohydrate kinase family protein [Cohnella sp. OV330]SFB22706.1 Sugar or nucleoside kinase, ribokinase family [Cohnella sp. OV330]